MQKSFAEVVLFCSDFSVSLKVSASADNSLRTWVLDGGDDMPRQLVILEGHAEEVTSVRFNGKVEVCI